TATPGKWRATNWEHRLTGSSRPRKHASNSNGSTRQLARFVLLVTRLDHLVSPANWGPASPAHAVLGPLHLDASDRVVGPLWHPAPPAGPPADHITYLGADGDEWRTSVRFWREHAAWRHEFSSQHPGGPVSTSANFLYRDHDNEVVNVLGVQASDVGDLSDSGVRQVYLVSERLAGVVPAAAPSKRGGT
ncbi:MAG: hypothetical protein JWR44_2149, partial [Hymenobacter sp.]|nr:hypothetical protein [Hymenobacter sp.]